ncbi:hypothetical protein K439DRAFT_1611376 [Ramaria rubella]|nr:hypothetical protein K439DRAFT_1611376 [Ramaria rubella]
MQQTCKKTVGIWRQKGNRKAAGTTQMNRYCQVFHWACVNCIAMSKLCTCEACCRGGKMDSEFVPENVPVETTGAATPTSSDESGEDGPVTKKHCLSQEGMIQVSAFEKNMADVPLEGGDEHADDHTIFREEYEGMDNHNCQDGEMDSQGNTSNGNNSADFGRFDKGDEYDGRARATQGSLNESTSSASDDEEWRSSRNPLPEGNVDELKDSPAFINTLKDGSLDNGDLLEASL